MSSLFMRKKAKASVADENMDLDNARKGRGGLFWLLINACGSAFACLVNNHEEEERRSEQRLWFASNPSIAEKNYLAVSSGMRYAIHM